MDSSVAWDASIASKEIWIYGMFALQYVYTVINSQDISVIVRVTFGVHDLACR